jgi:hypothetical protein
MVIKSGHKTMTPCGATSRCGVIQGSCRCRAVSKRLRKRAKGTTALVRWEQRLGRNATAAALGEVVVLPRWRKKPLHAVGDDRDDRQARQHVRGIILEIGDLLRFQSAQQLKPALFSSAIDVHSTNETSGFVHTFDVPFASLRRQHQGSNSVRCGPIRPSRLQSLKPT